jgi:hypothetical protein
VQQAAVFFNQVRNRGLAFVFHYDESLNKVGSEAELMRDFTDQAQAFELIAETASIGDWMNDV